MKTETVRLNRVTVQSRGSVRLNDVNLHIYRGEIMGLICVNQYGLDTLISLLCQNIPIHYGHVYFRETLVNSYQSSSARLNKTAVIDRNSRLVEHLTVSDNIFVMRPGFKKFIIPEKALDMQLDRLTRDIGVSIRGASRADGLPPFERCAVELLRAVASGTALVILRDVSNFLGAAALPRFHSLVRRYAAQGLSFLYICGDYKEVFQICRRAALMENGEILKVMDAGGFDPAGMPQALTQTQRHAQAADGGAAEAKAKDAAGRAPDPPGGVGAVVEFRDVGYGGLRNFSMALRAGECLVLLDRGNSVLGDFAALAAGLAERWRGEILVDGRAAGAKKNQMIRRHFMVIAENPVKSMLFQDMSAIDNLCFPLGNRVPLVWSRARIRKNVRREYGPLVGDELYADDIAGLPPDALYRLIYYRVHLYRPKAVFCVQPFAGVDMDMRVLLIRLMRELQARGVAVVVLTVSPPDSRLPADRVITL